MKTRVAERDGVRFVECVDPIARVDDALGLVSACVEQGSDRLLIESRHLPAAFFDLRSLFAGNFIQKLQNYGIRLAAVFPPATEHGERFDQFLSEARRGQRFRVFTERGEAEAWLAS